jgi:hypothetical protein
MRPWLSAKFDRLDELAKLEPGWLDRDNGDPVSADAVDTGKRLVALIAMLTEVAPTLAPQIVPTPDGGLQFEFHEGGWDAEIDVDAAGKVDIWAWHKERDVAFSFPEEDA